MYVQSMTLENVKAFEKLTLEFERPVGHSIPKYAGLNFFVGGNSSGKSTILKCLAMALSGPTIANQQLITPAGWLRRGAKRGLIDLRVSWDAKYDQLKTSGRAPVPDNINVGLKLEPIDGELTPVLQAKEYRIPGGDKRILSAQRGPWNADASGWFLGAYGPWRRLTGSSTEAVRYALARGKLASCVTLFREDAALSESETWLKQQYARTLEQISHSQPASSMVDQVMEFLNDGLLPSGFRLTRVSVDDVYMETPNGGELPLRDLSDGCRSIYALMLDVIHSMAASYGDKDLFGTDADGRKVVTKPGVILIDEIESHLHPSWQRTICEWLKTRFPNVQFFITTHSPITLQAADDGGIFVLPLPNELQSGREVRRLSAEEQKRIVLGRADKVLLGAAFGLKQTWSIRAERLVDRWAVLAALSQTGNALTAGENAELQELREQVELVFDDPSGGNGVA